MAFKPRKTSSQWTLRRPRRAAVGLGQVDVSEPGPQRDDRLVEALLLDVHVVRVEVDEDVGLVYAVQQLAGLRSEVDEVGLVAVDGLDPQRDALIRGGARPASFRTRATTSNSAVSGGLPVSVPRCV